MSMTVSETIYYVRDFDAAVSFYAEKLGWRLIEKLDWGWAQFDVDGIARVGLLAESAGPQGSGFPSPRVGLKTDDLDREIQCLREVGVKVEDPVGEPGQTRATTFYDPDGNLYFLWSEA